MQQRETKIHYADCDLGIAVSRREGNRGVIFAIHGLGCTKDWFGLREIGDFTCLSIDLPGFGDSERPHNFGYRLEDHAHVCKLLIESAGLEKVHLTGHSMGGAIGLILIQMIPERIMSFVNVEGNLVPPDSRPPLEPNENEFKQTFETDLAYYRDHSREPHSQTIYEWAMRSDACAYYRSQHSLSKWSHSGRLLKMFLSLKIPKVFVYGDRNANNPGPGSVQDRVQTIIIPESGHFMMLDNPNGFYDSLTRFYAGL